MMRRMAAYLYIYMTSVRIKRKAIRRSDPGHHWGNRFSILYITLSRLEVEALGCEGSWLRDFTLKEQLLESVVTGSISSCT